MVYRTYDRRGLYGVTRDYGRKNGRGRGSWYDFESFDDDSSYERSDTNAHRKFATYTPDVPSMAEECQIVVEYPVEPGGAGVAPEGEVDREQAGVADDIAPALHSELEFPPLTPRTAAEAGHEEWPEWSVGEEDNLDGWESSDYDQYYGLVSAPPTLPASPNTTDASTGMGSTDAQASSVAAKIEFFELDSDGPQEQAELRDQIVMLESYIDFLTEKNVALEMQVIDYHIQLEDAKQPKAVGDEYVAKDEKAVNSKISKEHMPSELADIEVPEI